MEFWKLFVVALMPVLKVLLVTAVGTFLALDRFDILNETARKHLNTMVFFVFAPTLVCSSLAETITFKSLVMLWFMPGNVLLTFIIGTVLGWLLLKTTRVPHHLQGLVLGCCAAGNLGNLPLIIVPAVCKERSNPFGDVGVCYRNALAYASLSMALGSVYTWSYVYNIIRIYNSSKISNEVNLDDSLKSHPENISTCSAGALVTTQDGLQTDQVKQLEIECTMPVEPAEVRKSGKIMKQLKILAEKINLKVLFAPATTGAIVGLIIGAVPPFRNLLVGDNAPLRVVEDSVIMLGAAGIPAMTLLVGANLIKGLKGVRKQLPVIVGIVVVRFIALPIIGIGIVKGAVHLGLIHNDPLYQFLLLLQFALPPAVAISTITQLFGAGEGECSVIMLATYSCSAVSLTLWCTFFMWLVL
ncbi:protein PIN-LIKES 3-like [Lotus japonicus]|uniref:protein PIN-LIKES 3-like n=1 Tax=Lotus japonicus TaxID=34305 RepID=UPI0025896899|nr:protein PIN-LIKES 3-like [Lotus japonicus]XP_057458310.1 protein PIN-LIKES 3-like [Lotus japonicus]